MKYKPATTSHTRACCCIYIFYIFRLLKTLSYQGLSASIDDKINVCDDKINVCDDKINICDDKINICDDKINSNNLERQNKHKG